MSSFLDKLRWHSRRPLTRPYLINSVPKAGTHLVGKMISQLPGMSRVSCHLGPELFAEEENTVSNQLTLGIDFPRKVPAGAVEMSVRELRRGTFATTHAPFSRELEALFDELGVLMVLVLRDPRAIVVSHAQYIMSLESNHWHGYYSTLSPDERIQTSIRGIGNDVRGVPPLLDIAQRLRSAMSWQQNEATHVVRFENLVGPRGGGNENAQIRELQDLGKHLGIRCPPDRLHQIAAQSFGGTATFHKGRIDSWRGTLGKEHVLLFKEIAGQLLIDLGYETGFDW